MTTYVAVGRGDQKYFAIGAHTHLVIAGVLTGKGASREKVETLIAARLSSFHREKHELSLCNVSLVFRQSTEAALKDAFSSVEAALSEANSAEQRTPQQAVGHPGCLS